MGPADARRHAMNGWGVLVALLCVLLAARYSTAAAGAASRHLLSLAIGHKRIRSLE